MTGNATAPTRARDLYRRALVWDMTLPGMFSALNDIETLQRYRNAGFGFVSVTIGNDSVWQPEVILKRVATLRAQVERRPDSLRLAHCAADIARARAEDRLAVSFHLQGTNGLSSDLAWVERFFHLGITHMLLAYNARNAAGDGCAERSDAGLSRYGVALVREMTRVGMLVDGAHSGYRTTMEAMEIAARPFIFSHANAHTVFAHYRNIRDDQIAACARTGGVIGITGVGAYLGPTGDASAELIFRHVDHVASRVGAAHVGFGLDFITDIAAFARSARESADKWPSNDGKPVSFEHFAMPEILEDVVALMCRHGYSDDDVMGALGANFLRVFQAVVG